VEHDGNCERGDQNDVALLPFFDNSLPRQLSFLEV
jgi:hypothetical protein